MTETAQFSTTADLTAAVAVAGSWSALTTFTVAGLTVTNYGNTLYYVQRYVGQTDIPGDIRRLRKNSHETMQRLGQPVIVKHMWNDHDARSGVAKQSPITVSAYGGQTRNRDPFSYGTGYCSVQLADDEWLNPTSGELLTSDAAPVGYIQAPYYRGYGPGFLTYILEPDVAIDAFKLTSSGALIKTQSQTVVAPWFPQINDNDLIINVTLSADGYVSDTHERYQAKMSHPVSIRGTDRRGRREYGADHGNRFVINQQFEMSLLPETSVLYQVETDR